MHAQIGTVRDPELRVQIVAERSTFDEDPASEWSGVRGWAGEEFFFGRGGGMKE